MGRAFHGLSCLSPNSPRSLDAIIPKIGKRGKLFVVFPGLLRGLVTDGVGLANSPSSWTFVLPSSAEAAEPTDPVRAVCLKSMLMRRERSERFGLFRRGPFRDPAVRMYGHGAHRSEVTGGRHCQRPRRQGACFCAAGWKLGHPGHRPSPARGRSFDGIEYWLWRPLP